VFTGVGKTRDELDRAVALGMKASTSSRTARRTASTRWRGPGVKARVALRGEPGHRGQHPRAHFHRQRFNKFGVPIEFAAPLLRRLAGKAGPRGRRPAPAPGSQMLDVEPLGAAARALAALARDVRDAGLRLEHLDVGGGLGIGYDGAAHGSPAEYASAVLPAVRPTGLHLLLEPGRFMSPRPASWWAASTGHQGLRREPAVHHPRYCMTELIRPMLYDAFHRIVAVAPREGEQQQCEVVGPLCETSDTLGHQRQFGPVEVDEPHRRARCRRLRVRDGVELQPAAMPAEWLVDGGTWRVVRKRQSYGDLFRNEE